MVFNFCLRPEIALGTGASEHIHMTAAEQRLLRFPPISDYFVCQLPFIRAVFPSSTFEYSSRANSTDVWAVFIPFAA